jgi:Ni,Fe-hydrogenase maturation factor
MSKNIRPLILVFGNEFIEQDNLAIQISKELKLDNVDIERCYSVNDLFKYQAYQNIFILDVVRNLEEVALIENIDIIKTHRLYSLHDFDLGFFLKLMKQVGELKKIRIIGIPQKAEKEIIKKKIKGILKKFNG